MAIKVAHVVRQYHPSIGGMEDVVENIARYQIETQGQVAAVITLDRVFRNEGDRLSINELVHGVPVVRLPFYGSERYPLCPSIIRHIESADVVHVHGIDFFFDYLALTKLVHGKPLIASTHGGFFHTRFASRLKKVYFRTITRASAAGYDKVIATSENDGEVFGSIVRPDKLEVIENGVDVDKYRDKGSAALTPTLIYFGRWSVNKGLLDTLDLFEALAHKDPKWLLILAGRQYDYSADDLEEAARARGLSDRVHIVANPSAAELAELIGRSSYFVCLSRHEGFGIAPIEAMSAGLTPILSAIPPFLRLLDQSGIGIRVVPSEVTHVIGELQALHEAGQSAYDERRATAKSFAARYGWCSAAGRYVDLYRKLVSSRRTGTRNL